MSKWLLGFVISCVFIWCMGYVFISKRPFYVFDAALGYEVSPEESEVLWRMEGWATTYFGEHGLLRGEDALARNGNPKIFLWGDSHVEAYQVPHRLRMQTIFNEEAQRHGLAERMISVGESDCSAVDYFYRMPKYKDIVNNVQSHVILLSSMGDVLPDQNYTFHSRFNSKPKPHFTYHVQELNSSGKRFGPFLVSGHLQPFYQVYRGVKEHKFKMARWSFSEAVALTESSAPESNVYLESWNFLLDELIKVTDGHLVFVYCPLVPIMDDGSVINRDGEKDTKQLFSNLCSKRGIGFIDMTYPFLGEYSESRRFVRGFFNSFPSSGHFNALGHKLIGHAMFDHYLNR